MNTVTSERRKGLGKIKVTCSISKQGLEDVDMPLLYNLHVTFFSFISQTKFNITPGIMGSLEPVKN